MRSRTENRPASQTPCRLVAFSRSAREPQSRLTTHLCAAFMTHGAAFLRVRAGCRRLAGSRGSRRGLVRHSCLMGPDWVPGCRPQAATAMWHCCCPGHRDVALRWVGWRAGRTISTAGTTRPRTASRGVHRRRATSKPLSLLAAAGRGNLADRTQITPATPAPRSGCPRIRQDAAKLRFECA
jgi:hypothetical protein